MVGAMARTRREAWVKHVAAWRDSGLSARQFAARVGVNAKTLSFWKWKLEAEAGAATKRPAFVEVTDAVAAIAPGEGERLEVVCPGGRMVRVPAHFEATALLRLLDALEGR